MIKIIIENFNMMNDFLNSYFEFCIDYHISGF